MDYQNYGDHRWELRYGAYTGPEKAAADLVYGLVQSYVPYIPTARSAGDPTPSAETVTGRILLGTLEMCIRDRLWRFHTSAGRSGTLLCFHRS